MKSQSNWHLKWGNLAQIVSAVTALCAVIGVIVQLYLICGNAKDTSARQVYMSCSEATLKYRGLSQPNLDKIKADPVEYVRYKNYVSHMLFAFDEILSVYDTPEWRNSFNEDLKYHMRYICEGTTPDYDKMYFPKCATSWQCEEALLGCAKEVAERTLQLSLARLKALPMAFIRVELISTP
jgi:hypothetical protein